MGKFNLLIPYNRPYVIHLRCAFCLKVLPIDVSEFSSDEEARVSALSKANQEGWLTAFVGDDVFVCCGRCLRDKIATLLVERFLDGQR